MNLCVFAGSSPGAHADYRAAAADLLALAAGADRRLRDAISTTLASRAAYVACSTDELVDAARLLERLGVE